MWIEPELTGEIGAVTNLVPARFEAYVRILHPAATSDGVPVRWNDVAVALGRDMHALRQWHVLVGRPDPDDIETSDWDGADPECGDLEPEILEPLCVLLGQHTKNAGHCFFGLWTGTTTMVFHFQAGGGEDYGGVEMPASVADIPGPRFDLPPDAGREYLLLSGPLSAAVEIAKADVTTGLGPTSPNLIWPEDRSWFVATEIDFDSTLVGGSEALIESIVESKEIEAWRVGPADSLAADADEGN